MISYLQIDKLTKSFGDLVLFEDITFGVAQGQKIGLIAKNGTGKTTLLNIIGGKEDYDSGEVVFRKDLRVGYLEQSPSYPEELTVLQACFHSKNETVRLIAEYEEAMAKEDHSNLEDILTRMDSFKAWDYEQKAKQILGQLKIHNFNQKIGELSGGQLKRVALANVLITDPELIILDEPTNHLDAEMAEWLENYLKNYRGAMVMVTHDRYFLDSVCNRIVEVDKGQIYSYETNYSGYLAAKQEREDIAWAGERKRQSILRKEIEWMQRGAKARSTKQKAHIQRYEALRDQKKPDVDKKIEIGSVSSRMGKTTVELSHITKTYGDYVLISDFSYIFLKNDRIGFVGKNGCGKTTLMKIIDGRILPDAGEVTIGQTIKIGYYTQEIEQDENAGIAYMDPKLRVIDYIKNTAEYVRTEDGLVSASAMLDQFLFPPEEQYGQIKKLSGGEKRRLNLLRVLMEAPNVLILDEPTNDLDITTLTILEDYLDRYDGIVITVSHDRYFLDRVVHRIFAFEGNGKLCQYEGGYTDYHRRAEEEGKFVDTAGDSFRKNEETANVQEKQATEDSRSTWKHENKLKFSYKEQKEYETIEDDIAALETRLGEIDGEMASCARDFVKLNELTEEKTQLETQLEEKMDRWTYLEELAAKILQQNA
jgi:ATP-binding cassette subfamily F protein uup